MISGSLFMIDTLKQLTFYICYEEAKNEKIDTCRGLFTCYFERYSSYSRL